MTDRRAKPSGKGPHRRPGTRNPPLTASTATGATAAGSAPPVLTIGFFGHAGSPPGRCFAALSHIQVVGAITALFGSNGGKKSHREPKLLADGGAKTAAFAPPHQPFSNVRYWRKADIGPASSA